MANVELSYADSKILSQVFDPEGDPGKAEVRIDASLPADRYITDSRELAELKRREKTAIALIEEYESASVNPIAKDFAYRSALEILDQVIRSHPRYASAKNNRAQLRRWRFGDHDLLCQQKSRVREDRTEAASAVVDDLQSCIALTSPERREDPVSPAQGRLLAQAYTQLAALYHAAAKDLDSPEIVEVIRFNDAVKSKHELEEEASRLFYLGGWYGNQVARALAVHTNPHARLCGNIVKEAMRKEMSGIQC